MIYEWKDGLIHLLKCVRHWFRALACKDYYTESHGLGMCGRYGTECFCEYWRCPKRKEQTMNNIERHPRCPMRTTLGNCNPIGGFCTSVNEPICEAFHRLYKPQGEWIPCSERLPEKPNTYTVTDSKGDVVRFVFNDNESSREYWLRCAKAWMPLPEPWKGADDE